MNIWLVHSGWMGNGCEAIFVEAADADSAGEKALELFRRKEPSREYSGPLTAEPLRLNEITECDGWNG